MIIEETKTFTKSMIQDLKDLTKALDHKIRIQMIDLLKSKAKMNVTDISIAMRLEQSVTSQHLAILRKGGIVKTERLGKYVHYSLSNEYLNNMQEWF